MKGFCNFKYPICYNGKVIHLKRNNRKTMKKNANLSSKLNFDDNIDDLLRFDVNQSFDLLNPPTEISSFDDVLKYEDSLTDEQLKIYANKYLTNILDLYKTTRDSTTFAPIFKFEPIHSKLIDAIDDKTINELNMFVIEGVDEKQRPIISIGNRCLYKKADNIIFEYSKSFIEYILPRLESDLQFVILTILDGLISIPKSINYDEMVDKYTKMFPRKVNIRTYIVLLATHFLLPEFVYIDNIQREVLSFKTNFHSKSMNEFVFLNELHKAFNDSIKSFQPSYSYN